MERVKSSTTRKALWLVIFIIALFYQGQTANAQSKDTLWTRDVWPLTLINGVFSPDDQFIYATCLQNNTDYFVRKYNLNGDLISKIDTIGGIRQFSEDGRFFWNYNGDKYDAITFEKLFTFGDGINNISNWMWSISEQNDIGVVVTNDGKFIDSQFRTYYYDNFKIFKPSTSKVIMDTAYPGNIFTFNGVSMKPNSNEVAFLIQSIARDYKGNFFTDTCRIEIWNIESFSKIREIEIQKPKNFGDGLLLKYSPDGSVLGYQHDGELTLYSTTDYSVIWENNQQQFGRILNFTWSEDNSNLYLSFYTNDIFMGVCKLRYSDKSIIQVYQPSTGMKFINLNHAKTLIITHLSNQLELLDNTLTSVSDPIFTENYKTTITQNQTNSNLALSIDARQPNIAKYIITNSLGKICTKLVTFNLEQGQNNFDINVSNLNSGIYFLNLTIEQNTANYKFMIVR